MTNHDAGPDDAITEPNLDAVLARPVHRWLAEMRLARAFGMSLISVRDQMAAVRRKRRAEQEAAGVTDLGEDALRAYLRSAPADTWQDAPYLAVRFDVMQSYVRQEMRREQRRRDTCHPPRGVSQ